MRIIIGAAKKKRTEDYFAEKAKAILNNESSLQIAEYKFDKLILEGVIVVEQIKVEKVGL